MHRGLGSRRGTSLTDWQPRQSGKAASKKPHPLNAFVLNQRSLGYLHQFASGFLFAMKRFSKGDRNGNTARYSARIGLYQRATFLGSAQQKLRANVVDRRRGGDRLVINLGFAKGA